MSKKETLLVELLRTQASTISDEITEKYFKVPDIVMILVLGAQLQARIEMLEDEYEKLKLVSFYMDKLLEISKNTNIAKNAINAIKNTNNTNKPKKDKQEDE